MTATATTTRPEPRLVPQVVAYVVHDGRVLVFTHDEHPLFEIGVQVPAGAIGSAESPAEAAAREVRDGTGLQARVVRGLGTERYDMWPARAEVHERHFFHLEPVADEVSLRWSAGESLPAGGGVLIEWTCFWIPIENAHVLSAGFGARLGELSAGLT